MCQALMIPAIVKFAFLWDKRMNKHVSVSISGIMKAIEKKGTRDVERGWGQGVILFGRVGKALLIQVTFEQRPKGMRNGPLEYLEEQSTGICQNRTTTLKDNSWHV